MVYQANYSLRLDVKSHEDPDLMDYFEDVVGDRTLDGIIIVPQYLRDYPFLYPLRQRSFPYVMMRPACFGADVNYVDLDNSSRRTISRAAVCQARMPAGSHD